MIFKDYYKILGLETNKVELEQIKVAFREQAKKYHPDVNSGKEAEERFKDINEAYRVLTDSKARRKYDRIWYSYVGKKLDKQSGTRENKSGILNLLFGVNSPVKKEKKQDQKNSNKPSKGENIETGLDLKIEEAFYGVNKKISLRAVDGKMKNFSIKIPAGIRNGEKVRLIGQGKRGTNGGRNGDLLIKINIINDKKYRLKGYDIYTDLELAPWEAVLGTKKRVEAIDEECIIIVPKGICSGEKLKLEGKGYKDGKGGRGKLIAEIKIVVPKKPSEEEIEIYNKLKELTEPKNS